MPLESFIEFFVGIHICKYVADYKFSNYKLRDGHRGYHIVSMNFDEPGDKTFSVSLKDRSNFSHIKHFKYSPCRLIIGKPINGVDIQEGIEFIDGTFQSFEKDYYIESKNLEKGKYYAFVDIDWEDYIEDQDRTFNVTCYGAGGIQYEDVSRSIEMEDFLKQIFLNKFSQGSHENFHIIDMADKRAPDIKRYFECQGQEGYVYTIIDNQDTEAIYTETLELESVDKLQLLGQHQGAKYSISVGPQQKEIVLIRVERGFEFVPSHQDMNVFLGDNALKAIAIAKNFKLDRLKDEIYLYKAWHDHGFVTLYINKSTDKILTETVDYMLTGLEIVDDPYGKSVQVNVGPGEEQLIKLIITSGERSLQ